MAVLYEVQLSDAVDVDRGHRLPSQSRRGDALPPPLEATRPRPKQPVEFAAPPTDSADDRLQGDRPQAEIVFRHPSQGRHNVLEGQHDQPVAFHPKCSRELRQRLAATHASEGCGCVWLGESSVHVEARDIGRIAPCWRPATITSNNVLCISIAQTYKEVSRGASRISARLAPSCRGLRTPGLAEAPCRELNSSQLEQQMRDPVPRYVTG
jgi:hypothetical protein